MALTHTETKISEILKKYIPKEIHNYLNDLKLIIVQTEDKTKIMILKVPQEIIDDVKQIYRSFDMEIKRSYPDYHLYMIRKIEREDLREPEKKVLHEQWIKDLAFPALVQGRRTMITTAGKSEEALIERKYRFDEKDISNRVFVFKTLTEKAIKFTLN
ncbi:hypothetical protein BDAP_000339 [Binucleata daphniae]